MHSGNGPLQEWKMPPASQIGPMSAPSKKSAAEPTVSENEQSSCAGSNESGKSDSKEKSKMTQA